MKTRRKALRVQRQFYLKVPVHMDFSARRILVTGGTGIIGGSLIPALVAQGVSVVALVRGTVLEHAKQRLQERFDKNISLTRLSVDHIQVVLGDTTLPRCGLDLSQLTGLTDIIHCSGSTAFKDDEPGWLGNKISANKIIELARSLPKRARIFYVSTASVCIPNEGGIVHEENDLTGFTNGYIESKRTAEEIFLTATDLPVVILRPSIVIGQNIDDKRIARSILWVIPAMAMLGDVPLDADSHVDLVSVQFVADTISLLACKDSLTHTCYHISAGPESSATCGEIVRTLEQKGKFVGQIRFLGMGPWPQTKRESQLKNQIREAMDFYVPFLNADVVYSRKRLGEELGSALPICPSVTTYIMSVMQLISEEEAIEESHRP